jgi:hypothetical protein
MTASGKPKGAPQTAGKTATTVSERNRAAIATPKGSELRICTERYRSIIGRFKRTDQPNRISRTASLAADRSITRRDVTV